MNTTEYQVMQSNFNTLFSTFSVCVL